MNQSRDSSFNPEPGRGNVIRPKDIVTPDDYWEYTIQRLGDGIASMPTVRVPYPTLVDVMALVMGLLRDNEGAYNELQIFEVADGDYVFTSDFDTPDAGDGANAYFQARASTKDQKAFASAFANTIKKLHVMHRKWSEAGKPIRPKNQK